MAEQTGKYCFIYNEGNNMDANERHIMGKKTACLRLTILC